MVADPKYFEQYPLGLAPEAIPEVRLQDALTVVNGWEWSDVKVTPQAGSNYYFEVSERTKELLTDLLDVFDDSQPAASPCLKLVGHEYPQKRDDPEVVVLMTGDVKEITDYFPPAGVTSLPLRRRIGEYLAQQEPVLQSFSEFMLEINDAYQQFKDPQSKDTMPDELVRFFEDLESNYKYQ